jgi:AraC-like DNA-binding protein
MKYQKFIPRTLLSQFIDDIIVVEISYEMLIQEKTRVLPNGHVALVIHFTSSMKFCQEMSDVLLPDIFFSGNINKQIVLKPIGDLDTIIIQFKPNALYHLFGVSMCELNFAPYINAKELLNHQADLLYEQLKNIATDSERVQVIENHFESLIKKHTYSFDITDIIINRIIKDKGCVRVSDLTQYFNVAERSLRRNMLAKTGYSPKEFIRIVRFDFIMQQIRDVSCVNWSDVISAVDFFDQSHLIKEFKSITGSSPNEIIGLNQLLLRAANGTL